MALGRGCNNEVVKPWKCAETPSPTHGNKARLTGVQTWTRGTSTVAACKEDKHFTQKVWEQDKKRHSPYAYV